MAWVGGAVAATAAIKRYRCGVCGRHYESHDGRVHQCEVCATPLCDICEYYGLCEKHYYQLDPEARLEVQESFVRAEQARKKLIFGMLVPLIFGVMIFGLLLASPGIIPLGGGQPMIFIMAILMGGICIFLAVVVKAKSEDNHHRARVRVVTSRQRIRERVKSNPSRHEEEKIIEFKACPECGAKIPENGRYCEQCGAPADGQRGR